LTLLRVTLTPSPIGPFGQIEVPLSIDIEGEASPWITFLSPSLFIEKGNLSITRTGNWRKGMSVISERANWGGDECYIRE
jgi:hypothetical protein